MNRNVVFVWVPRTGGQSVWRALSHSGPEFPAKEFWREPRAFDGHCGAACFGHYQLWSLVENGVVSDKYLVDAFKFAFVRNPFDRLVSWFARQAKSTRGLKSVIGTACSAMEKGRINPIGFYNTSVLSCLNPQVRWLEDYPIDFIGQYESLEQDFARICSKLGIGTRPLERTNESKHRPYREYFSPIARDIAVEFYREDCKRFGYVF